MSETQAQFNFLDYRVTAIHFDRSDLFGTREEPINQTVSVGVTISTEDNRLADVKLDINLSTPSESLKFSVSIVGRFRGDKEIEDSVFRGFLEINAPAIIYPYARALISSYSAQAALLPIILPTMNFARAAKAANREEKDSE